MPFRSDDLLAARRLAWARATAQEGELAAAIDLLHQTLERVPDWLPARVALAETLDRAGDEAGATAAWERVEHLDQPGVFGAPLHLARLRGHPIAEMPEAYVRTLFDGYAPRFDHHLSETLGYRAPALLSEALAEIAPGRRFQRAMDLGCGTGLVGQVLRPIVAALDGVDLSPAMIERARATGAYRSLEVCSLAEALVRAPPRGYDLVTAADVLVYVGDLGPVMAGIARALAPEGVLVFTIEGARDDTHRLGPDLRFSHSEPYVRRTVDEACLRIVSWTEAPLRAEKGRDVAGFVVCAAPASGEGPADHTGRFA